LYGGVGTYPCEQDTALGGGGVLPFRAPRLLPRPHPINEAQAAALCLLPSHDLGDAPPGLVAAARALPHSCVRVAFVVTTHAPVDAGHDGFSYELFERLLPDFIALDALKQLAGNDRLNMPRLALNLAGYVNGVARRHAQTTEQMFPGYRIRAVTNGVHAGTWTHAAFAQLYTAHFPEWHHNPH